MTITTLQQTLANAWRTYASRIVAVILSLALLVVGVFAYRSASVPASIGRAANQRSASAPPTAVVPAARRSGSASAGQGSQTTYRAVLPDELDYLRVLSDEQVRRYIDARPDRFQAYGFTRGPVLPDELDYLRVLSDEQVRRYIDARQGTPRP